MLFLVQFLAYIEWNPNRVFFIVPYLNHPVVWYGVLFAVGFLLAYIVGAHIFLYEGFSKVTLTSKEVKDEKKLLGLCQKHPKLFPKENLKLEAILPLLQDYIQAKKLPIAFFKSSILTLGDSVMRLADKLTTHLVVGLIIGARLGYVFFYGWPLFKSNPLDIFKIWEGGLASHGACLGILVALFWVLHRTKKSLIKTSFFEVLDILAIISGILAFFIRIGNFINQEIVGTPTQVFWAILFKDPLAGESLVPRHPVQLYEALFYLLFAVFTYALWRRNKVKLGTGQMSGILLCSFFTFRFFIEFFKEHQGLVVSPQSPLQMGQILSLPFVLLGLFLILRPYLKKRQYKKSLP